MPASAEQQVITWYQIEDLAQRIFSTCEDAKTWLAAPHPLLGGLSPLDAARTSAGAGKVRDLLVALQYGGAA
ncbi:antitoxin Xre/MbcA/ParS toxin-binding domain-containing protein [Roseateles sp. UC29_93]|uniref:antitoxin Xre/MbcA/ParS toxin-binding domain-containing protein n=1 Tax=Roseateles sp. UC29_93 TaxID=3350177 RepID=UPI00366ED846